MTRHYSTQSFKPFPSDINREAFGHWVSGFTDGEGCFGLHTTKRLRGERLTFSASFSIGLRGDDRPTLEQIQSFFGCGTIRDDTVVRNGTECSRTMFKIVRIGQLQDLVVPHFERFPLRAKKSRDFIIWRQGVSLISSVAPRKKVQRSAWRTGTIPKWTDEEYRQFLAFHDALKSQRTLSALLIEPKIIEAEGIFPGWE